QAAKEGLCPIEHVGITALTPSTLAVDLEYPCPEFLELTALPIYSPVPHYIDKMHPDWGLRDSEDFVCNGPFLLKKTSLQTRHELIKNSLYWEQELVKIQQIHLSKDSSIIAHSMFQNEEIDWLGMPLRPWEPFFEEHLEADTSSTLSSVHWALFNTEKFPFHNTNLRKAFSLAIDPKELASRLPYTCFPAFAPLPPSHTMNYNLDTDRGNETKAVELFEIALQELGLTRKQLPLITITFANTILREKTARFLAEKWGTLFQIPCRIEKCEYSVFFSKLMKADFQCTTMHWKSLIDHPLYTLKIFKYRNDVINFPRWFHPQYHNKIEEAQQELDPNKKIQHLSDAEKLLIEECPLIPLYYEKEKIIKKRHLRQASYSPSTGHFDLKNSYIER
ncbi:MAG: hypothetical protein KGQ54_06285, partial [Verrucomicrobia bacterium]|nr:hypothetical protein [Verrucomicrobiota bacterium]